MQNNLSKAKPDQAEEILTFWFGKRTDPNFGQQRSCWFVKDPKFDQEIRDRFLADYHQAAAGQLTFWEKTPDRCLALIILLDQFSRNLFRGTPQAFATDAEALRLANHAVHQGFDQTLLPVQCWFLYLPFEHSESWEDQVRSLELWNGLRDHPESARSIIYAEKHAAVIQQFGRFPHRNAILGRPSTDAELEFLSQPGSSF